MVVEGTSFYAFIAYPIDLFEEDCARSTGSPEARWSGVSSSMLGGGCPWSRSA